MDSCASAANVILIGALESRSVSLRLESSSATDVVRYFRMHSSVSTDESRMGITTSVRNAIGLRGLQEKYLKIYIFKHGDFATVKTNNMNVYVLIPYFSGRTEVNGNDVMVFNTREAAFHYADKERFEYYDIIVSEYVAL